MKKRNKILIGVLLYIATTELLSISFGVNTSKNIDLMTNLQKGIFHNQNLETKINWNGRENIYSDTGVIDRVIRVDIKRFNKNHPLSWIPILYRYYPAKIEADIIDETNNDTLGQVKYFVEYNSYGFIAHSALINKVKRDFTQNILDDFNRNNNIGFSTNKFHCYENVFLNLTYFVFENKPGVTNYCIWKNTRNRSDTCTILPPNNIFNGETLDMEVLHHNATDKEIIAERYYSNRQIACRVHFKYNPDTKKAKLNGDYLTWYPNGQQQYEIISPDIDTSFMTVYHRNGNLKNKFKYQHEQGSSFPIDTFFTYHENGKLIEQEIFGSR